MKTVFAIVMWTLSLFGIELGHQVRIDRVQRDGADVLYSKVDARPDGTRFECLRSASGKCYYTVALGCTTPNADHAHACEGKDARRFALASGDSRQVAAAPAVLLCVSTDPTRANPRCD